MSYRWGFDLDMTAVRLMRREGGHWREIAVEKIEGADIEDRLMALVDRIDPGEPVDLFLPREQILYTDVKVSSESAAPGEIEAAMDGRTPYAVDELEIDWELSGDNNARVAAIALETLDEAAAFAEARGLSVRGYSSIASPEDFPRMPDFGSGPGSVDEEVETSAPEDDPERSDEGAEDEAAAPVTFASARQGLRGVPTADRAAASLAEDGPVVRVDDPTPVMQVRSRTLPPLNPGLPLERKVSVPRVRTDIAAATVSGQAASLSPVARPSVRVMRPAASAQRTLLIFAVALLLTIAIAWVVWSILPMTPGRTEIEPPAGTEHSQAPPERAEDIAGTALPDETGDEVADAPQPEPETNSAALGLAPVAEDSPDAPAALAGLQSEDAAAPTLLAEPDIAGGVPIAPLALEQRPEKLAGVGEIAPEPGPDTAEDVAETTDEIYFASIEPQNLAFDAIALPAVAGFAADDTPSVGDAPAPFVEATADAKPASDVNGPSEPTEDVAMIGAPEAVLPEINVPDETATSAEPADTAPPTSEAVTSDPGNLVPSALAAALPDRAPRARPQGFVADIERSQFGGRTRDELARLKPPPRPESAQSVAVAAREPAPASKLAVGSSAPPKSRPEGFDNTVAAALSAIEASRTAPVVNYDAPDTSAAVEAALSEDSEPEIRPQDTPRLAIPSGASVARQATLEDAIRLNQINLIGVYGVPSDRRALIRLPSGRYVKVKVGDRIDGGTVASISDSSLVYRKGSRSVSLSMPEG